MPSDVAQGTLSNFSELMGRHDTAFNHGDVGRLELRLRATPPGLISSINAGLSAAGVNLVEPVYSAPGSVLTIRFIRNPGPIVIAAAILALIAILLISWRLVKETGDTVGSIGSTGMVLLIGAAAYFLLTSQKRKGSRR